LAASSQPAARAGGAVEVATTGGGIRIGCWGGVAVRVGFGVSPDSSFSSESNGAATRNASTSFSNRVSSSSFCLKTSYTFFMLGHLWSRNERITAMYGSYPRFVKKNRHSRVHDVYRNTTITTRTPRTRTTIASRFTWLASHDSFGDSDMSRNDGIEPSPTRSAEADGLLSLRSQSRQ